MNRPFRVACISGVAFATYVALVRPRLQVSGATAEEHAAVYPGDELIADSSAPSTFAATLDAPPEEIWPWLIQMGSDRGGFYSWDRLDNGGEASADRIHPEWQDLEAGGRIRTVPGRSWFDVEMLERDRTLVLRASIDLSDGRSFDPRRQRPRVYMDGVWSFHLRALDGDRTRLIARSVGASGPPAFSRVADLTFFPLMHWIMQVKQFDELKRRVERR